MFGSFGLMELLLILFIVLIVFGAGKLPQLGEGVGKAIKGFKRSVNEVEPTAEDVNAQGAAASTISAPPESVVTQVPPAAAGAESPPAGQQDLTPRQA
jgi:sec-independent protein translocase protein TatA